MLFFLTLIIQAKLGSISSEDAASGHLSSLSSEQKLRDLELELARTKLALVESDCKNQELEHRLEEYTSSSSSSLSKSRINTWFKKK